MFAVYADRPSPDDPLAALVALVLLVIVGYLINDMTHHSAAGPAGVVVLV